jgi:hypothetical protein
VERRGQGEGAGFAIAAGMVIILPEDDAVNISNCGAPLLVIAAALVAISTALAYRLGRRRSADSARLAARLEDLRRAG